jgi:hypothetical protein
VFTDRARLAAFLYDDHEPVDHDGGCRAAHGDLPDVVAALVG